MSKSKEPTVSLYFRNKTITSDTLGEIAAEFGLPVDLAKQAMAQIRHGAVIDYSSFPEDMHEKLQDLFEATSTTAGGGGLLSPEDQLSDHATNGLIAAATADNNGHFIITDGICEINLADPPELEQAYQVMANVLSLGDLGKKVTDKSSWMMGSMMASLRDFFGEEFEPGQVANSSTRAYNTIYQAEKVFLFFRDKRYNLPYSSHQEAYMAAIPEQSKHVVLRKAETFNLSPKEVRTLCSVCKLMGDDQVVRNIRSRNQAEALIETYRESKVEYLVENINSTWTRIKGTADSIPTGIRVIDLKHMTIRHHNGEPQDIPILKKS